MLKSYVWGGGVVAHEILVSAPKAPWFLVFGFGALGFGAWA